MLVPVSCRGVGTPCADNSTQVIAETKVPSLLPKIIATGFKAIHLIYFFTAGEDEVCARVWTVAGVEGTSSLHVLEAVEQKSKISLDVKSAHPAEMYLKTELSALSLHKPVL